MAMDADYALLKSGATGSTGKTAAVMDQQTYCSGER